MLISYVFRGQEVDIDVLDKREPYEWTFYGIPVEDQNAMNITAEEEEAIAVRIGEVLYDQAANANPFED